MTTASPMVRKRRLGQELKRLRETANLKGAEASKSLGWSASKLSRIEAGRSAPTPADVTRLLDLYGVDDLDQREKLEKLTREARKKGWWQLYSDIPYSTYIGLEAEAEAILTYETVVPGLFQTSRYAEAINRATGPGLSDEALEQRHDVRMQRQQLLEQAQPVEVRAVLDESALCRQVGGREVMHEQLAHLLELAARPNVLLQVIPFTHGAHPGTLVGPFVILRFAHPEDPDVVYVEANTDPYVSDSQRYEVLFDNLRANAVSAPQTLAMIKNRMKEL
ncbi:helix-turn-helix domain-containing protein [Streptomyces millisiae]|uniref:Helix-turn-helix transcriptional regulator n=1 Tax=Streptomyces millisiae TaxID=3075542 RepID=A0ABU2LZ42_9ACTN|nr:helix-turn-helix transcriptional regulator [Streptomyces sp. DSM 44918]MDT0322875.1 helix-turn-helix transcriptional regulator [Streptomyces sp. DSM 44918]